MGIEFHHSTTFQESTKNSYKPFTAQCLGDPYNSVVRQASHFMSMWQM